MIVIHVIVCDNASNIIFRQHGQQAPYFSIFKELVTCSSWLQEAWIRSRTMEWIWRQSAMWRKHSSSSSEVSVKYSFNILLLVNLYNDVCFDYVCSFMYNILNFPQEIVKWYIFYHCTVISLFRCLGVWMDVLSE